MSDIDATMNTVCTCGCTRAAHAVEGTCMDCNCFSFLSQAEFDAKFPRESN